ncbi:S1C family serine protease [Aliibacillus thermotolerans]|uniref:S1C family serine protease n=1 Tax=Aliibacillus thermotolerans TaxID=1834418 RepID=A0ABW0U512_9BACI|nr:serine protease [Aliibacillus thermotolerans]MDA3130109.1 trypsin-like serine protease [Aliibacillus thermotolerans]
MSEDKKNNNMDELYEEKYEELTYDEFKEALQEEESSFTNEKKEKKRKKRYIRFIAILIAFFLVFQIAAMMVDTFRLDAIDFLKTSYQLSQNETIQDWRESVVVIHGTSRIGQTKGTGFFIDENGLLLTNHHVVDDLAYVGVTTENGEVFEGELVASDEELDLALVSIEARNMPTLPLREETIPSGEHIFVIGNPLSFTKIANEGEVMADHQVVANRLGITAPIYRGNSGSPVITETGEVTGVVYAKTTIQDQLQQPVGLAVKIEDVHSFLEETFSSY